MSIVESRATADHAAGWEAYCAAARAAAREPAAREAQNQNGDKDKRDDHGR
jgi:hypothetical protein